MTRPARWPCPNCARPVQGRRLFCADLCRDVGGAIRYIRKKRLDGTSNDVDIYETIGFQLANIASGGCDRRNRLLTSEICAQVIRRADGFCARYGHGGDCWLSSELITEIPHP